ncbi:MAG: YhfC family intramembrane metalloprotease [Anaerolineae bacterium]|nr:YhfC family intramembrane metalloprotease [Anaerolineae bacterium]
MLVVTFVIEIIFVFGFPIALGVYLRRRFDTPWKLYWVGAATFIASQVVHIPLNLGLGQLLPWGNLPSQLPPAQLLLLSAVVGLSAGVCEEGARYLAYRFVIKQARTWREALMFGAGHGGFESMFLVGLSVALTFVFMLFARGADVSAIGLTPDQVAAYWGQAWYNPLLGAAERLFAICLHVALAVLVLQAFTRQNIGYLFLAIGWHALVDGVAVMTLGWGWPFAAIEGLLGLLALVSLALIWAYRPRSNSIAVEGVGND